MSRRPAIRPRSAHDRVAADFYCESPWASAAIFRVERFAGLVWDPTCGLGGIPDAARAAGHRALGSDIVRRNPGCLAALDFLAPDIADHVASPVANIVSNPPFALAERFVARSLDLARVKVAMLLPLAFLEGEKRSRWLETTPLARVWVSRARVGLRPGGEALATDGGTKAFAWLVWEHGWRGPAQLGWFDRVIARPVAEAAE